MSKHLVNQLALIGCGSIGSSLLRGLSESADFKDLGVSACDQHQEKLDQLDPRWVQFKTTDPAQLKFAELDVIIVAVKPHDLDSLAATLGGMLRSDCLVLSLLAGRSTKDIAKSFGSDIPIVRAMPNIAVTVHQAATALCANDLCQDVHRQMATSIFSAVGTCDWVPESLMNAVTALSGSGPAYQYLMIEALADAGVKLGIPRDLSSKLAKQTLLGASLLAQQSNQHPAQLRDQVITPGGTTINALYVMEDRGFRATIMAAVEAACQRGMELESK